MTATARFHLGHPSVEMTDDPLFAGRIKRLVGVSVVALGLITLLVAVCAESPGWVPVTLMAIGWVLMPSILAMSLRQPWLRYLLSLPAVAVSAALLLVSIQASGSSWATAGWWLMTGGVLMGGSLGTWFWYRWLPVPRPLDTPTAPGRMAMILVHVLCIVCGGLLVLLAWTD